MLAIIPARKGSVRLPNKNTRLLAGKPLICYTIEAALKSSSVEDVLVVSNDDYVWGAIKNYKHDVWGLIESDQYSGPDVPMEEVILYTLGVWRRYGHVEKLPSSFVLLQPTSPFRTHGDIDIAHRIFKEKGAYSVVSMRKAREHPKWSKYASRVSIGRVVSLPYNYGEHPPDLDYLYPNGAIYICETKRFKKLKTFYDYNTYAYMMALERSVDIDYEIDFILAEALLEG